MSLGAFVSLEDISDALPPYREEIVSVEMDAPLKKAYEDMEEAIKKAFKAHRGNSSVASVALNALLAYPDRPYGFGDLIGREFNPETQRREPFLIAAMRDLNDNCVYAKERRLLEEIKSSLERGRKVQVFAVYTQKRDVTRRLESIIAKECIRVAVSADAVWKRLVEKQAEVFGVRAVETSLSEMEADSRERDLPEVISPPPVPIPVLVTQFLMFGGSLESAPRRKASGRSSCNVTTSDHLGLFQS
jgi:hypothetical protein